MTDDVFFASISELNERLKKREFSTVELVREFGQKLEQSGPRLNALALPLTEFAVRRAKAVDDEWKRERLRGPLQGIPFGVIDTISFAGQPTTWGAKPFAAQIFGRTAAVLEKLDKTGSVLTGKLAATELGNRLTSASLFGRGLNPWDRTRWSGGSSSGPAAAVAAGLVAFALGSEGAGSILIPAAFCGVTGLRPTYGLVSRQGAMPFAWTMDTIGPLCRSAEDCGLVLQAIAGGDTDDQGSAGKGFYYTPQYARKLSDLTIAYAPADLEGLDGAVRQAFETAIAVIRAMGAKMKEAALPSFPYTALADIITRSEGASVFEDFFYKGRGGELADAGQADALKAGADIYAKDYLRAMRIRTLVKSGFRELFGNVDILLAPAQYRIAPKAAEPVEMPGGGSGFRDLLAAGNLAGLPALTVPCGLADSMPLGLQLAGPAFSENSLLAVAAEFQRRTDWHRRRPSN